MHIRLIAALVFVTIAACSEEHEESRRTHIDETADPADVIRMSVVETMASPFVESARVPWQTMSLYGCAATNPAHPACLSAYHSICVNSIPSGTFTAGVGPLTFDQSGVVFLCVRPGHGVDKFKVHDGSMANMSPNGFCAAKTEFSSPACNQAAVRFCDLNGMRGGQVVYREAASGMNWVLCGDKTFMAREAASFADLNLLNGNCNATNGDSPTYGSRTVACRMAARAYCQSKSKDFALAIGVSPFLPGKLQERDSQALHFTCLSHTQTPSMYNKAVKFTDYYPSLGSDIVDYAWSIKTDGTRRHRDRTRHSYRMGADGHPYYTLYKGNRPDQGTIYKFDLASGFIEHLYDPTIPSYRYPSGESATFAAIFDHFPHVFHEVTVGMTTKVSTTIRYLDPMTCKPREDADAGPGRFMAPVLSGSTITGWAAAPNTGHYEATVKVNYIGPSRAIGDLFQYADTIELELMRNCATDLAQCRKEVEVYQRGRGMVHWKLVKGAHIESYDVRDESGQVQFSMLQANPWENTNNAPKNDPEKLLDQLAVKAGKLKSDGSQMYPTGPLARDGEGKLYFPKSGNTCGYRPQPF